MWDWLRKLPGAIGGGIKTGISKIGGMMGSGDDEGGAPMVRTPDFNPDAQDDSPMVATRPKMRRLTSPDQTMPVPVSTSTNPGDIPTQIEPRALPMQAPPTLS